jgi:hypothetical protein
MHDDRFNELIPCNWTYDQALAVVYFLDDLAEAIWSRCVPPVVVGNPQQLTLPLPPIWWHRDAAKPL